jgi:glycerophosphoryl diester phosphodiesterase
MNRPLLLGHRGLRDRGRNRLDSNLPRENSLAAFEFALTQGCDGFEFDLRHSRDGRNVVWHDPDCSGREIAASECHALLDRDGMPLADLEGVLARFGHRAYLDVELKVPGYEESVVAALRANPPQRGYIVTSFLPEVLQRLHDLDCGLPLGFIFDRRTGLDRWRELPVRVVLPRCDFITKSLVEEAHHRGPQIMTWTVNDARQMREFADWGIDGLISDDPRLLYQTFHSG